MLLTDEQIEARVSSSGNLLNRLGISTNRTAKIQHPSLPVIDVKSKVESPSLPPRNPGELTIDDLIHDVDSKIQVGQSHTKSINILNKTLDILSDRLEEIEKPEKLGLIAFHMHRIVNEQKTRVLKDDNATPQIIIYKPMMINVDELSIVAAPND
jgi:hypothetical protein